jgi:outer membrane biosynthesis protein TonB
VIETKPPTKLQVQPQPETQPKPKPQPQQAPTKTQPQTKPQAQPISQATPKTQAVFTKEPKPKETVNKTPKQTASSAHFCTACKKAFTQPLVMLNFEGGKSKLVNVCPYCSYVLGNVEEEKI